MNRVLIEIPPHPYYPVPTTDSLVASVRVALPSAAPVEAVITDAGGIVVNVTFDAPATIETHRAHASAVATAVEQLGLYATRVAVTRIASRLLEGALGGVVSGLGLSRAGESDLTPWIVLIAGAIGSWMGSRVTTEVQALEWRRDNIGRWWEYRPAASSDGPEWGWQPS